MSNNLKRNKQTRTKTPFIRSFGYYITGTFPIALVIHFLLTTQIKSTKDFVGGLLSVIFFGGFGVLMFIVGWKRRKY